jgi:hypothetical protein
MDLNKSSYKPEKTKILKECFQKIKFLILIDLTAKIWLIFMKKIIISAE